MYSIIAVTNKHTAKLHHVGSLYILTYDARKLKHKIEVSVALYPWMIYPVKQRIKPRVVLRPVEKGRTPTAPSIEALFSGRPISQ